MRLSQIINQNIVYKFKMGPRNSKESQLNFMRDYDVIQTNPTDNISFLRHKKTEEEYLLKEFNFNDKKECEKTMEKLAQLKVKLAGNKHVVPLKDYLMSAEDQYCSTFYKIYAVFQYPQRTLDDEISQRRLHGKRFTETELWSILASCIVGLSHLQKNGIKHSTLKSSNILLSREGIIKVSDPFALGQPTNYDAALTKRSTQNVYLSPEQTQALQQELVIPTYNHYKSDIWTLGMIMLEAGLLENRGEECYRDDRTRIHWETVQYNIDRLGQAYSDEIKNMVEFTLSRDERARPDWIDLEEHVMKGGDDVRRSIIQDQPKVQGSFINSDSFTGGSNGQPLLLNARQGRNSDVQRIITNPVPTLPIQPPITDSLYGQLSPRVQATHQMPVHHTSVSNGTFNNYPRPQSPRIMPSSAAHLYSQNNTFLPQNPSPNPNTIIYPSNNFTATGHFNLPSGFGATNPSITTNTGNTLVQQQSFNIAPLKPSVIDLTRPIRNIFPSDTYITKTKFDENLIIMPEEDQETEQDKDPQNAHPYMIPQQAHTRAVNVNNAYEAPRVHYAHNQFGVEPPRYSSYSSPGQSDSQAYNNMNNQNRVTRPFASTNYEQPRFTSQQIHQQVRPSTFSYNNQPQFITQEFRMGSRYEGYKLNGLRHGYGKFYYQDGGMYDGDWKENKMEGFGKLLYQSGKLAYEGDWKNDQFMGRGILYNEVPEILNQPFEYSNFDDVEEFWTKYEGQFADDMKNGKGVLYLSNGERFDGNFVADSVEGPGVFYCKNGTKVTGTWVGNRLER